MLLILSRLVLTPALLLGLSYGSHAATLNVANNGVDSGVCGPTADPCRSINQAIMNASPGDRIRVGPGSYTPTTETPPSCAACMVEVNKDISLESVNGAGATILDVELTNVHVVQVTPAGAGARIGRRRRGFTMRGSGDRNGLLVDVGATGVNIQGNVATRNDGFGFELNNDESVQDNIAALNGSNGFRVNSSADGARLQRNVAQENSGGFLVGAGAVNIRAEKNEATNNTSNGFEFQNDGAIVRDNSSRHNSLDGFDIRILTGGTFQRNLAHNNGSEGFDLSQTTSGNTFTGNLAGANGNNGFDLTSGLDNTFNRNVASGNEANGFRAFSSSTGNSLQENAIFGNLQEGISTNTADMTIEDNNIFGNDSAGGNCGVENLSSDPLTAENNYWGAATGPGAEPADDACENPGMITTAPFAAQPFNVPIRLGQ